MSTTPRLELPYLAASQYQKEVSHNISLDRLDLLCQCAVLDRNLSTPPASPTVGEAYIVGPSPTGAWAGQEHALALWVSLQWELIPPRPGFLCWVMDETVLVSWSGSAWVVIQNALTFLGLADTPDTYSGQAGKAVVVNAGGTALEFGPAAGGATSFLALTDTPDAYSGAAQQYVRVTAGATALEFGAGTVASLLALSDTPDSYTGQQGRVLSVTSAATGIEFVAPAGGSLNIHRGALLLLAAAQSLPHDTATILPWGSTVYDTNSLWSASQPTRFVVPSGVNRLMLLGQVECDGPTNGQRRLRILKNGTTVPGQGTTQQPVESSLLPSSAVVFSVQTPPLEVTGGDYFELEVLQTSGGAIQAVGSVQTWFSVALITVATDQVASSAYDVGVTWNGTLPASQVLIRYPFPRAVTFPPGLPGSRGTATVAATALTTLTIAHNGTSVGSVQFAAGAPSATFTLASETTFALGDVLTLVAPASPDSTLANLGLALAGTRAVTVGEMGATTFLGLTDTPASYAGQAGALVRVTGGATGLEFTPGAASETVAGLVELATSAETTTGTDTTRAVTPAGLAAKLPAGTPLSVARYAADGATLEAAPLVVVDATGQLGVGTATPSALLSTVGGSWRQSREAASAVFTQETYISSPLYTSLWCGQRGYGTSDAREAIPANVSICSLEARGITGAASSGAGATIVAVSEETFSPTAHGSRITLATTQQGTTTLTERLRIDSLGNLSTGGKLAGTSGQKVLVLASGTAPSTSPTDAVQTWAADRAATAGKAALHVRTEDGTSHVLGDLSGIGTLLTATLGAGASYQALNVNGGQLFVGQSSVQERPQALFNAMWVSSTDATRTARLFLAAYDATAAREGVRVEADGSAARLGFYGGTAVVKPTVTGVKGGNTALASLVSALANLGLIVDSTT